MTDSQSHVFQAEIKQLLNILIHSLYKDREIFVRELVSNASDALNRLQFEMLTADDVYDADADLYIHITFDEEENTLRISDTGIGMTAEEMVDALGVIARSGAKAFLDNVGDQADSPVATDIIGQFGVGFYSVFMAAERVEVISRSFLPDAEAAMWVSSGDEGYEILPAEKETRGTDIIVYLRDDASEFASDARLRRIIRHHSDFIPFPIYIGEPEEEDVEWVPVNQQVAIWRRNQGDLEQDDYDRFYQSLTLDMDAPALTIHSKGDAPIQYYSLLFIPSSAERSMFSPRKEPGLKLYARKVLIQDYTTDLLPEYLQFVQGVVDSEDLPLSVSREAIQSNALVMKLKNVLTRRILTDLKRMADNEPEEFEHIWLTWSPFLKQGIITSFGDRDRLLPLLHYYADQSEGQLITLEDYVDNMVEGQEAIYYVMADDVERASRSVHLEAFRARGIDVLYLVEAVDGFVFPALGEYMDYPFVAVDSAALDLDGVGQAPAAADPAESVPTDELDALIAYMADQLGDQVESVRVSKVLAGSPARLVAPEGSLDRHQQRLYQMLDQEYEIPARILELNPSHPIVRNLAVRLARTPEDETLVAGVRVLYQNALLADGLHPNPSELVDDIQKLLEQVTAVNGHNE